MVSPKTFCHPKFFATPKYCHPVSKIFCHGTPQKIFVPHPKNLSTIPPLKMFGHPIPQNILPCLLSKKILPPHPPNFFLSTPSPMLPPLHHNSMFLVQFQHLCLIFLCLNIYAWKSAKNSIKIGSNSTSHQQVKNYFTFLTGF